MKQVFNHKMEALSIKVKCQNIQLGDLVSDSFFFFFKEEIRKRLKDHFSLLSNNLSSGAAMSRHGRAQAQLVHIKVHPVKKLHFLYKLVGSQLNDFAEQLK